MDKLLQFLANIVDTIDSNTINCIAKIIAPSRSLSLRDLVI